MPGGDFPKGLLRGTEGNTGSSSSLMPVDAENACDVQMEVLQKQKLLRSNLVDFFNMG